MSEDEAKKLICVYIGTVTALVLDGRPDVELSWSTIDIGHRKGLACCARIYDREAKKVHRYTHVISVDYILNASYPGEMIAREILRATEGF